jgi:RNA polymerase sigma factor (sigma-70 family)
VEKLALRIKAGEIELMVELWMLCLRYIKYLARQYKGLQLQHYHIAHEDMVQSGYFALVNAVKNFKEGHFVGLLRLTFRDEMFRLYGIKYVKENGVRAFRYPEATLSLDEPIENSDGVDWQSKVNDLLDDYDLAGTYEEKEFREIVEAAVKKLEPREQAVIAERFWFEQSRAQVAITLSFRNEKEVMKVEAHALEKLRDNPSIHALWLAYYFKPTQALGDSSSTNQAPMAEISAAGWMQRLIFEMGA